MNPKRYLEAVARTDRDRMVLEMGEWVHSLAPWQVFATLTFRRQMSLDTTARLFERFMRVNLWGVSYFYAVERNPSNDGFHVHALWVDCKNLVRRDIWADWQGLWGNSRILPVHGLADVADYCAKYVVKTAAWWNVRLMGSRHPSFAQPFKLDLSDDPGNGDGAAHRGIGLQTK